MKTLLLLAGACASALAFAACGGSDSSPAPPSPDAGSAIDSGGDVVGVDGAPSADAGPDVADQDPNVYPSKHQPIPQVDNAGGPIIDHPKLVTVTFTGDPLRDQLRTFVHAVGTTTWWHQTMGTYGIADATAAGDYEVPDTISGKTLLDADFQAYVQELVAAGTLPAPDAQTVYLFYLPASALIDDLGATTCTDNGGYHNLMTVFPPNAADGGAPDAGDGGARDAATPAAIDVPYAILPRCYPDLGTMTYITSHEIAEAVTDPQSGYATAYDLVSNDAWIPVVYGIYGEVGDLCSVIQSATYDEGSYKVQRIWSNAAAMASKNPCQPAALTYYGAAVRTTPRVIAGKKKDGHLAVKRGQSIDAIIDFFSEAALPKDVTLKVGLTDANGGFNALPQGITAKLSRTSAHNGNTIVMTIAAQKNAAAASLPIIVRSSLSAYDFNDWPVILSVQ